MKPMIFGMLLVLSVIAGCAKKQAPMGPLVFQSEENGLSFVIPPGFHPAVPESTWADQVWEQEGTKIRMFVGVRWNKDLKYFPLPMCLDILVSSYRAAHNRFHVLETKPFTLESRDALSVRAKDGTLIFRGVYFVANNREYFFGFRGQGEVENRLQDLLKESLKNMAVADLPDHKKYMRKILKEQDLAGNPKIVELLDFGQQLISSREMNIKNYPKAIKQFRKALDILQNIEPKPPEYSRALRQITIAKELQKKSFQQHEKAFKQSMQVGEWTMAKKESALLVNLIGDDPDDPRAQAAQKYHATAFNSQYEWESHV